MIRHARIATPLGPMVALARDDHLVALDFVDARHAPHPGDDAIEDARAAPLAECARQLAAYFAGERLAFDLPLAPAGTAFQQRIWHEIAKVPAGSTLTYGELAARAGCPASARAAGAATGRNRLAIVIPCHRIVGAGGALTGYAGGLSRKARLLAIEGAAGREVA